MRKYFLDSRNTWTCAEKLCCKYQCPCLPFSLMSDLKSSRRRSVKNVSMFTDYWQCKCNYVVRTKVFKQGYVACFLPPIIRHSHDKRSFLWLWLSLLLVPDWLTDWLTGSENMKSNQLCSRSIKITLHIFLDTLSAAIQRLCPNVCVKCRSKINYNRSTNFFFFNMYSSYSW